MYPSTRLVPRRVAPLFLLGLGACFLGSDHSPPPVATQLEIIAGNVQTGTVGQPLGTAISVRVVDQNGDPVGGAMVRFAVGPNAGSLVVTEDSTDLSGIARSSWRLPTLAGSYSASASVDGLNDVTFHASAVPDRPDRLVQAGGDGQVGEIGATLGERISARIVDQYGNGIAGIPIGFTAASGNGRVLTPLATSGPSGTAQTLWQLGTVPGSMQMRAKSPNIQSIPFDATALPPAP